MNILETIVAKKKIEVENNKRVKNISALEKEPFFKKPAKSFRDFLLRKDKTGIIAEFKRKSPSKGMINSLCSVEDVVADYIKFGASAVSVLTDKEFFGGDMDHLLKVANVSVPVLRKDFIIDEYQLIESKANGADVILLIAACLSTEEVKSLATVAKNIGLNVLLEIHGENELGHICSEVDVTGINNRDLKTFKVDLNHSIELCKKIPGDMVKVSESGIDDVKTIRYLKENGFNGFLMGEKFMKEEHPGNAFRDFVSMLK